MLPVKMTCIIYMYIPQHTIYLMIPDPSSPNTTFILHGVHGFSNHVKVNVQQQQTATHTLSDKWLNPPYVLLFLNHFYLKFHQFMTISITFNLLVARLLSDVSHIWHNAGYDKYVKHAMDTYVHLWSWCVTFTMHKYIRSPSVAWQRL